MAQKPHKPEFLELTEQRFVPMFAAKLSRVLKVIVQVNRIGHKVSPFAEVFTEEPVCFSVVRYGQLRQPGLLAMDRSCLGMLVNLYMGGTPDKDQDTEAREIAALDQKMAARFFGSLCEFMNEASEQYEPLGMELRSTEAQPVFVQILPEAEPCYQCTFEIVSGSQRGRFFLLMPETALRILNKPVATPLNPRILQDIPLEVTAILGEAELLVQDLLKLQKGDVIPLRGKGVSVDLGGGKSFQGELLSQSPLKIKLTA